MTTKIKENKYTIPKGKRYNPEDTSRGLKGAHLRHKKGKKTNVIVKKVSFSLKIF
jgi:hypothetical protein